MVEAVEVLADERPAGGMVAVERGGPLLLAGRPVRNGERILVRGPAPGHQVVGPGHDVHLHGIALGLEGLAPLRLPPHDPALFVEQAECDRFDLAGEGVGEFEVAVVAESDPVSHLTVALPVVNQTVAARQQAAGGQQKRQLQADSVYVRR